MRSPPAAALAQESSCAVAGAQPSAWGPGPQGWEVAAAFLFGGSTGSKAEHVSQRYTHRHTHTHTHRGHRYGRSHRLPQTGRCLQQHPPTRLTSDASPDNHVPSSSWAGRGRRSLVQHTHHTLQVRKHTHIHGSPEHIHSPSACPALLPGSWTPLPTPQVPDSPAGPAGCLLQTRSAHTLVPQALHTHRSPPKYQDRSSACLIPLPKPGPPTRWLVQLGVHQ